MKKIEYLNKQDRKYLNRFTKEEILACELVFGGIPLHDEEFIRNNKYFVEKCRELIPNYHTTIKRGICWFTIDVLKNDTTSQNTI